VDAVFGYFSSQSIEQEQTMSTVASEQSFDVEDVEYLRHGDKPLLATLYKPRGTGPFPMIIEVHGGAWCRGTRANNKVIHEELAKNGIIVAALDFRMPPDAGYPAALADVNYAVRYFKSQAPELRARAKRIGLLGTSSGGHLAMTVAMKPNDPRYAALPLSGGFDASVPCVIMCWPVIDPLGRYQHAIRLKEGGDPDLANHVLNDHHKFWGTEEAMAEGSPTRALERGDAVETPPVLYIQGTADYNHPKENLDRFVAGYRARGGRVELTMVSGEKQLFIPQNPTGAASRYALERIVQFAQRELQ
jgi:acetyl esterase